MLPDSRRLQFGASHRVAARPRRHLVAVLAFTALCLVGVRVAQAQPAPAPDSSDFSPTSDVPWNPPKPVPASLGWETALRLPGRVATLPLSALGQLSRRTLLVVEERSLVPRVMVLLQVLPRAGLTIAPASLGDRTGFGALVGFAPPQLGRHVEVEYSGSTRNYNRTRAALLAGPARLEYRHDWRPEERFHGLGMSSRLEDTTNYSAALTAVTLSVKHTLTANANGRPAHANSRAWTGARGIRVGRGRSAEVTPIEAAFSGPGSSSFFLSGSQFVVGGALELDSRSGRPHWSRGERLLLEIEGTTGLDPGSDFAFVDPSTPAPSDYTRVTVEFESGVSFWRDPRTVRLFLRSESLQPGNIGPSTVPVPDLPALGGSRGLAGFEPGRFHDLTSLLARVSYVFPLAQNFEVDAHVEAGGVFPEISLARADELETSYGVMLRPRTRVAPIGAFGVEWSRESVRVRYTLGGVE